MTATSVMDARVAKLELLMQEGFTRLGEARSHRIEVDYWERHRIELVREYEALEVEVIKLS